jgi:hypothetical protein
VINKYSLKNLELMKSIIQLIDKYENLEMHYHGAETAIECMEVQTELLSFLEELRLSPPHEEISFLKNRVVNHLEDLEGYFKERFYMVPSPKRKARSMDELAMDVDPDDTI